MKRVSLLLISLLLALPYVFAQKLVVKPIPSWVVHEQVPATNIVDASEVSNGTYYLLLDEQERIEDEVAYNHYAMHFLNEAGVSNGSEISVVYHPSYQQLHFHFVKLIREGKSIDQLKNNQVQFLQRETDLDYKMLDGSYTALLSLKDVRKGDVIEYAYSIVGRNPIFQGKFYGSRLLSFGVPVVAQKLRYTWNKNRQIHHLVQGQPRYKPKINESGNEKTLFIESRVLKSEEFEENIPYSFIPTSPEITLSEYETWADVTQWGLQIYAEPSAVAPNIKVKVKELIVGANTPEEKAQKIIRFVQDEIRYLGIEIGESSHRPAKPEVTLDRRFGDCKDKTVLLRAMLHEIGIKSYPMLVNTRLRDGIKHLLPGPHVFNHVVLSIDINNENCFIDATMAYQRGKLSLIQFPNYGSGLVIKPENGGLTGTFITKRINKKIIDEYFTIGDTLEPTRLKVVTHHYGEQADEVRLELANNAAAEIQKSYLEFYQNIYGEISADGKMLVDDNENKNELIITEFYKIKKIWTYNETEKSFEFSVYAQTLRGSISDPKPGIRNYPYGLRYPYEIKQSLHLDLPENWNIIEEKNQILNPAFSYTFYSELGDKPNEFHLNYHYITGRDYVDATEYSKYVEDIKKISDLYGYRITWNPNILASSGNSSTHNWGLIFLSLFIFVISAIIAHRLYLNYDPMPKQGMPNVSITIGGWLILISIGLSLSIGFQVYNFFAQDYYNQENLNLLSSPEHPYFSPFWGLLYTIDILVSIPLFFLTLLTVVLLFKRRTSFPYFYIILMISHLAYSFYQVLVAEQFNFEGGNLEFYRDFGRAIFGSAIWIPYVLRADKVKQTFTMMLKAPFVAPDENELKIEEEKPLL